MNMTRELSANIVLDNKNDENAKEREQAFRDCADPVEHNRQTGLIAEKLEKEISQIFDTSGLSIEQALMTTQGRELAAHIGPSVFLSQRDQFWAEQIADRVLVGSIGDLIYYTTDRDTPVSVVSASNTDGGAAVSTHSLISERGTMKAIQVITKKYLQTYEYDSPVLAESQASSRGKAVDLSRYMWRRAMQNLILGAWKAGQFTAGNPFPAEIQYDMPEDRAHPLYNTVATGVDAITPDHLADLADYFDALGIGGNRVLALSPVQFGKARRWVNSDKATDTGTALAGKMLNLSGEQFDLHGITVVKRNNIPDKKGMALVTQDPAANVKTLAVYNIGKLQSLPSQASTSTRSKFDLYLPGLCAANHNPLATAFIDFN